MTLENQIQQIKNHINDRTHHPYLDQFISKPTIDDDKIAVLINLFTENGHYKNINHYITAIMIMQMALEMHDTVGIESMLPSENHSRQLTVLAGDFYSSQYYFMLSECSAFSMIQSLSDGIRLINEEKVDLFKGEWQWSRFIDHMKKVETALLVKLGNYLELSRWTSVISAFFTHKRIKSEKQAILNGKGSIFLQPLFKKHPEKRTQFLQFSDGWLTDLREKIESEMKTGILNGDKLRNLFPIRLEDQFKPSTNKLVEEGLK